MKVTPTDLPEVMLIEPRVFGDDRGFFLESWNAEVFAGAGIDSAFVQDNHSRSGRGVLRGVHYQLVRPQGKLVRVARGRVFDVAVDLRRSSSNFGCWTGHELSDENMAMLWIPPGFGHGFVTLSDVADFQYKCTELYAPEHDRGVRFDDPALGIDWPIAAAEVQLSAKDRALPTLADAQVFA